MCSVFLVHIFLQVVAICILLLNVIVYHNAVQVPVVVFIVHPSHAAFLQYNLAIMYLVKYTNATVKLCSFTQMLNK